MELSDIVLTAIGGGAGGLIGFAIGRILPRNETGGMAPVGLVILVALSAFGGRLAPEFLDPYIGEDIRRLVAGPDATRFETELVEVMADQPFFVTVQTYAPERAQVWRQRVVEAYRSGGQAEAERVARAEGEAIGVWLITEFGPRASDDALLGFYSALTNFISGPLSAYPEACYAYAYGSLNASTSTTLDRLLSDSAGVALTASMVQLAEGASDLSVEYDIEAATAVQVEAMQAAMAVLGEGNSALFGQRQPANAIEYDLACSAMAAYFQTVMESEFRLDALRSILAASS